ncbi:chromatin modification-related protein EAF7-domain-containing protein [Xylaria cf. heliscus]|nr:chromatin modification-related protein EAF7-domain-containing protein [Xylaria cf. heliscus]
MPPKRKSKAMAEVSTPKASVTPAHDEDAMDISTPKLSPKVSETPRAADTPVTGKPNHPPESEVLGDLWTEDQISSLFKAVMRWKPSGMHKHFRVIAISEHLRNHGFDPDVETHTRIPGIWTKLHQFFDLEMIDERDNSFDYVRSLGGDEAPEEIYKDFDLPAHEFHDLMWARAAANNDEPDNWSDTEAGAAAATTTTTTTTKKQQQQQQQPQLQTRKRKRGDTTTAADAASVAGSATAKTRRSSTVDDTDQETPVVSSPVSRSARGARSQKRAAAKAKTESVASEHDEEEEEEEEEGDDNDDSSNEEEEEEEEEETEAPATRSGRAAAAAAAAARGRGRGRGRPKGGRKKN